MRGVRQMAAAQAYRAVAKMFHLEPNPRGTALHGYLGKRRIWVGNNLGNDEHEIVATIQLDRPLGVGLTVSRRPWINRLIRKSDESMLLDTHWESADSLIINAQDRDRARSLLNEALILRIAKVQQEWKGLSINDHAITVTLKRPIAIPDRLSELVGTLISLADALTKARSTLKPSKEAEKRVEEWQTISKRLGLDFEKSGPAFSGVVDGSLIDVNTNLGNAARVTILFEAPLQVGLGLYPQSTDDVIGSSGQDIDLHNQQLDDAFIIKGYDPEQIRSSLTQSTQEKLVQLSTLGTLRVDDDGLEMTATSPESTALSGTLDLMIGVASALSRLATSSEK